MSEETLAEFSLEMTVSEGVGVGKYDTSCRGIVVWSYRVDMQVDGT